MNWDTFWTAALCIVAITFCAGIYRGMVERDERRRIRKMRAEVAPWREAGIAALDGMVSRDLSRRIDKPDPKA